MPRISVGAMPGPLRVRGVAVEQRDGVGPVGQPEREGRHVELARVALDALPELEDAVDRDAAGVRPAVAVEQRAGHAPDEVRVEPLVARRDRRVDREHAVATDLVPGLVERRAVGDQLAGALGEQERGVALVEVPDRRLQAELAQRPHPAHAQRELLVEPHLASADVQDVGDRAVRVVVVGDVRVQQQHRHAAHLRQPDAGGEVPLGERHGDRERLADRVEHAQHRQPRQLVVGVGVLLVAVRVDRLAEEAAPVHEADADQRQGHVRGGLHVVAGEHPEATRVDAQRLVEAVLGAEVGDRPVEAVAVLAGEPVVRAVRHVGVEFRQQALVLGHERRGLEELGPVHRALQDRDRVAVPRPRTGIDAAEQRPGPRMPAPPEVVGEPAEAFELGRERERGARRDWDADEGLHERPMIDGLSIDA